MRRARPAGSRSEKAAEDPPPQSETRLRDLLLNMVGGYTSCRMIFEDGRPADFVFLEVNPAFEELTGLKGVVGRRASEVIAGLREKDPQIFEICGRVAMTGAPERLEYHVKAADIWLRGSVYRPEEGHFVAVFDTVTDIKRTEAFLRESNERLKKILEAETVGVMFWDLTTGRMTDANDTFLEMMGYSRGEVEAGELTWQRLTPPEYVEESLAEIRKFNLVGRVGPYEKEYLRKDGGRRWFVFAGSSLGGNSCVEFCVDISRRKRAEEALRLAHARLRRFVDANVVGILIAHADGTLVEANDYYLDLIGASREEFDLGLVDWRTITPPEWLPADERAIAELREHGVCAPYEKEYVRPDGRRVPVFLVDALLPGPEEQIAAFVIDLTALKRAEAEVRRLNAELEQRVRDRTAELQAVNRELEAFAYSVSHDLKAPLRSMDGYARILEEGFADRLDDEGRRLLRVIRESSREMGELIDALLAFSRMIRKDIRLARIDMGRVVDEARHRVLKSASGRDIRWIIEDLPPAFGDEAMVREVWINLLANAVKFTRKREAAVIEVGCQGSDGNGGGPVFYVRDNGVGFDAAYQDKLFGVFQRLHSTDDFEGAGIGLALVQRIVRRHGGQVGAEGRVDQGALFWFSLPPAEPGPDEPPAKRG